MGSINKTSKGEYSIRFWYNTPEGRKQKRLTGFKTKQEARLAEATFKLKQAKPEKTPNKITLKYLYDEYKRYLLNNAKESSYLTIVSALDLYVIPFFGGDKNMSELSSKDALDWKIYIKGLDLSYAYMTKIYLYFNSMMIFGCKYLGLEKNPIKETGQFKDDGANKEMLIWTRREFETFIKSFDTENYVYKVFFATLYFTGMRRGECLALQWNDIDFDNRIIKVNKTISYKSIKGGYTITPPKTPTSNRNVVIPSNLIDMLNKLTPNKKPSHFVFGGERALPIETIRRRFNYYIKKSGVKKIRIHDLRHSHVSLLISQNDDIVTIAKRLGHKNIAETLNTYSHMLPNKQDRMVKMLEDIDLS